MTRGRGLGPLVLSRLLPSLLLLPLLLLIACQGGSSPPQVLSFTADPAVVHPGETSTLRWTVTGADSIVLDPGAQDVSGANSAVVHPMGTTSYTLTATGAGGSDSAQVTVSVDASVEVRGRVIGLDGRPAAGVDVYLAGEGHATSDAEGRFVFEGVLRPYTIHLLHPSADPSVGDLAISYLGLTSEEPVLTSSAALSAAEHHGSVYGTVSAGTGFPQPASHVTRVTYASDGTRGTVDADGASGDFALPGMTWFGADAVGALHALQWRTDAGGLPVEYVGHGTRDLTLHAPIIGYLAQDMALLPVGEGNVSGTVELPSGYVLGARWCNVMYAEGGWATVAAELFPPAGFSYVTPTIPDAGISVFVLAGAPSGEFIAAIRTPLPTDASGVVVTVPSVPELASPAEASAGVGYDTEFT